jgi:hypothetical protein
MWQAKARVLNIPLSAKGHSVDQQGALTGLAINTQKGRFYMLPEKFASMVSARDELAAAAVSNPRVIAWVRGKALHYGCAVKFRCPVIRKPSGELGCGRAHHMKRIRKFAMVLFSVI